MKDRFLGWVLRFLSVFIILLSSCAHDVELYRFAARGYQNAAEVEARQGRLETYIEYQEKAIANLVRARQPTNRVDLMRLFYANNLAKFCKYAEATSLYESLFESYSAASDQDGIDAEAANFARLYAIQGFREEALDYYKIHLQFFEGDSRLKSLFSAEYRVLLEEYALIKNDASPEELITFWRENNEKNIGNVLYVPIEIGSRCVFEPEMSWLSIREYQSMAYPKSDSKVTA